MSFCSQRGVNQHALQVVSQHALQQVSGGGGVVVSQHALHVSRPTPNGEVEGSAGGGVSKPTSGGSPGPHPGGCLLQGGACSGGVVETPLTATAAGGTYPTGMHSCLDLFLPHRPSGS